MENDAIKARDRRKHLETTRGIKCEHSSSGAYTKPLRDEQHYITPKCRLESLKQSSEQFARSGQASTTVNMFCASICLWRPHDAPENDKQMHSRRVDALHELSMKRLGKSLHAFACLSFLTRHHTSCTSAPVSKLFCRARVVKSANSFFSRWTLVVASKVKMCLHFHRNPFPTHVSIIVTRGLAFKIRIKLAGADECV